MDCQSCEHLQSDINYLEERVASLSNEVDDLHDELENTNERLRDETKRADRAESVVSTEKEDEAEAQFLVSLFNLQTSSESMSFEHKFALAKNLIAELLGLMGVDACPLLV